MPVYWIKQYVYIEHVITLVLSRLFIPDLDDDHFDVYSELIPVATRWRSIGLALRLKQKTLDSIQAGNSSDPTVCLAAMVGEWLSSNYNVKRFGEPTWQRLVEAVSHPAGGGSTALAREMAERHKAKSMIFCSRAFIVCEHTSYHAQLS